MLASSPFGAQDIPWNWVRDDTMQNTAPSNPLQDIGENKLIFLQIYSKQWQIHGIQEMDHFEDDVNITIVFII